MSKTAPAHYPVDLFVIADQLGGLNNRLFSAFKYIARAGKKPGESVSDDLRKAIKCLEMEIARLEPKPETDWIAREYGVGPFDRYVVPGEYVGVRVSPDPNSQRVVEIREPGVRIPKASDPDPEWDALTANMTTPA